MRKVKWGILLTILFLAILENVPRRPRLISSITNKENAYLTVLVDERDAKDKEKLEEKLLKMCREDSFTGIKLQAEGKNTAKNYYIKVYTSQKALKEGKPELFIGYK